MNLQAATMRMVLQALHRLHVFSYIPGTRLSETAESAHDSTATAAIVGTEERDDNNAQPALAVPDHVAFLNEYQQDEDTGSLSGRNDEINSLSDSLEDLPDLEPGDAPAQDNGNQQPFLRVGIPIVASQFGRHFDNNSRYFRNVSEMLHFRSGSEMLDVPGGRIHYQHNDRGWPSVAHFYLGAGANIHEIDDDDSVGPPDLLDPEDDPNPSFSSQESDAQSLSDSLSESLPDLEFPNELAVPVLSNPQLGEEYDLLVQRFVVTITIRGHVGNPDQDGDTDDATDPDMPELENDDGNIVRWDSNPQSGQRDDALVETEITW